MSARRRLGDRGPQRFVGTLQPPSLVVPHQEHAFELVVAPDPVHHNLEHFLCYQATAETKLAKGIQVDVTDQFQTRRYDLVKITKVCNAVDKAGRPTLLSRPHKGDAKPITPVVRTVPTGTSSATRRSARRS
jgi:hypothetical protein